MKKRRKSQYHPFVDFAPPVIMSWVCEGDADIHWLKCKRIVDRLSEESLALTLLVDAYRKTLKTKGEDVALREFWQSVGSLGESSHIITDEMREVLHAARGGSNKACQLIVRAHPPSVHLKFVAEVMCRIINKFKYEKSGHTKEFRDAWGEFLPKRTGGRETYTDEDIARLKKRAQKQDNRPVDYLKGGTSLSEEIAEMLEVKPSVIKRVRTYQKRGRPRK